MPAIRSTLLKIFQNSSRHTIIRIYNQIPYASVRLEITTDYPKGFIQYGVTYCLTNLHKCVSIFCLWYFQFFLKSPRNLWQNRHVWCSRYRKDFQRVWDTSQQAKCRTFSEKGYSFPMLAPKLLTLSNTERKGKEWKVNKKIKDGHIVVKKSAVSRTAYA